MPVTVTKKLSAISGQTYESLFDSNGNFNITADDFSMMENSDVVKLKGSLMSLESDTKSDIQVATINARKDFKIAELESKLNNIESALDLINNRVSFEDIGTEAIALEFPVKAVVVDDDGTASVSEEATTVTKVLSVKEESPYYLNPDFTALDVFILIKDTDYGCTDLFKVTSRGDKSVVTFVHPTPKMLNDGINSNALEYMLEHEYVLEKDVADKSLKESSPTATQTRCINLLDYNN